MDTTHNRHPAEAPIWLCDLTNHLEVQALIAELDRHRLGQGILHLHLAPPRGTASRAREIPVSTKQQALGCPAPPPLRSEPAPLGLNCLQGRSAARVAAANIVYDVCLDLISWATSHGITYSLENPARSLFWIPRVQNLLLAPGATDLLLDHCMFGGGRAKAQRWRTSLPALLPIAKRCDKQHAHAAWGFRKGGDR